MKACKHLETRSKLLDQKRQSSELNHMEKHLGVPGILLRSMTEKKSTTERWGVGTAHEQRLWNEMFEIDQANVELMFALGLLGRGIRSV